MNSTAKAETTIAVTQRILVIPLAPPRFLPPFLRTTTTANVGPTPSATNVTSTNVTDEILFDYNPTSSTEVNVLDSHWYSGTPVFCETESVEICADTQLLRCPKCNMGEAALFIILVVLLGLAILIANVLVLGVVVRRKILRKTDNMDLHRGSLAVADLLNGIQILLVAAINFAWTVEATMNTVRAEVVSSYNSPRATVGGIFYLFTFTSSLYNLVFLAGQRVYAFVRPIHYKLQRKRTIVIGLVVTWLLAFLSATVPAWAPNQLVFAYFPNTLLYYAGQLGNSGFSVSVGLALLFILYFLPYLMTVVFLILAAWFVHKHVRKASKLQQTGPYSGGRDADVAKEEKPFLITTTFMVIGYTVTSIPAFAVVLVVYTSSLPFDRISVAYVTCFYISMTNSLVNVLVYSIRDSKFRSSIGWLLCRCCRSGQVAGKGSSKKSKQKQDEIQLKITSDATSSSGNSGQKNNQTLSTTLANKKSPQPSLSN